MDYFSGEAVRGSLFQQRQAAAEGRLEAYQARELFGHGIPAGVCEASQLRPLVIRDESHMAHLFVGGLRSDIFQTAQAAGLHAIKDVTPRV